MVPYRHKKDFKIFTTEYYANGDYGYQPMPASTPGKLTCSSFQAGDYYGYGIDWMAVGYIDLEAFLANNKEQESVLTFTLRYLFTSSLFSL